ncbi:hypothetical protein F9B85_02090 [Heliorestis acidaminivorans]|uniref:Uncharacterized protein n=1 Tax=Heliorestis acidaminivorans TaxID=553427 RepID=A0A6I0F4L3_9FIRM|nr:DUF5665 domain-containing protein [Heliorestis acidaminivorans]KAB2954493.1 hypothetical protein F9B85_02090 [Heliorestis acidaminivorans]
MKEEDKKQENQQLLEKVSQKLDNMAVDMEKLQVAEYIEMLNNPRRLMFLNFLAGIARGLGMAVGFTILGAIVLIVLRELVVLNLPLVGGFIAEVVRMVQSQMGMP